MTKKLIFYGLIFLLFADLTCHKNTISNPTSTNPWDTLTQYQGVLIPNNGTLTVKFSYNFNGNPIQLASKNYVNAANDTFNIEELKHYFSNLTLYNAYNQPFNLGNYNLLDISVPKSNTIEVKNIPAGNYTRLSFLLGVDSLRNSSGVQEGDLDPAFGMFWTWNTGYIFYRINGRTPNGSTYSLDLGGNDNVPKINLDLSSYKVKSTNPTLEFHMDVNEMFQNPKVYSLKLDGNSIHSNTLPSAKKLAGNMSDMVTLFSVNP